MLHIARLSSTWIAAEEHIFCSYNTHEMNKIPHMLYGMHTENWMAALLHYFIYLCFYIYANFMVLIQKVMTIVQWIRLGFINSALLFFYILFYRFLYQSLSLSLSAALLENHSMEMDFLQLNTSSGKKRSSTFLVTEKKNTNARNFNSSKIPLVWKYMVNIRQRVQKYFNEF